MCLAEAARCSCSILTVHAPLQPATSTSPPTSPTSSRIQPPNPCPVWIASAVCFPRYLDAGYEATSQHLPHTSHTTHLHCVCHVLFQAPRQLIVQQLPCPTSPTHPQGSPCPPLPPTWIESAGFQPLPHISHTVALPSQYCPPGLRLPCTFPGIATAHCAAALLRPALTAVEPVNKQNDRNKQGCAA